ncbi:MAG TPA: hypothetical protein VFR67_21250 [Pilimelia sp.]|nr:hypothetical protein [Pilimelia sp.]
MRDHRGVTDSLSRRAVIRAAGAGVVALGTPAVAAGCDAPGPRPAGPPAPAGGAGPDGAPGAAFGAAARPVSMAMHLHSSFSEGKASMAAHLAQASRVGVDVLFFSEHDFRVAALGYRTRLALDGLAETEHGVSATWRRRQDGSLSTADVSFAPGPKGSMAVLSATAGAAGSGALWLDAQAWNFTYRASLADTTLRLDVQPQAAGPDAYLVLELDLSHHPAGAGRPAGQYRLAYHIGPYQAIRRRADGLAGVVQVPAPLWRWSTVTLRPVDDIAALWPGLVAEDNSLHKLRLGVASRRGAAARYAVDHLAIVRDQRERPMDLVRRVMDRYARAYPDRRRYAALEVSLVRHLNWYGADLAIPDYGGVARPPVINSEAPAAAAMVEFIHSRGGLASYNHPLYGPREEVARHMVSTRALGADIMEIAFGSPESLASMLHVFDACARNLVFVTGNGVTDDHNGIDWYANPKSNWITKAWAGSTELPELLAALRAGRAWCYKPDRWSGELELRAAGRPAMGGVVVTGQRRVPLAVTATGLPAGGSLEIVTGRADRAAAEPAVTNAVVPAARLPARGYEVDGAPGTYTRAMVRDRQGAIVGVGNPVWLLPGDDASGVPPARRLTV